MAQNLDSTSATEVEEALHDWSGQTYYLSNMCGWQ